MLESILETKFTGLVFIALLMGIAMRGRGMKVVSKATECTPSEMGTHDVVNGMAALSRPLNLC